jgi:hypothetical protein
MLSRRREIQAFTISIGGAVQLAELTRESPHTRFWDCVRAEILVSEGTVSAKFKLAALTIS